MDLQQNNINKSSYDNKELILLIDFLQEWASAHPCKACKDEILGCRKELILELESRYIDNTYLKWLK